MTLEKNYAVWSYKDHSTTKVHEDLGPLCMLLRSLHQSRHQRTSGKES